MILLPNQQLAIGDRVFVQLPKSYGKGKKHKIRYTGTIAKQGYRSDQWVIKRDHDGLEEMVHDSFVAAISSSEKAA